MRRQARAINEYIPCAISWPKKTCTKVDPIRPALCVAWDQLQTMLVCPPEYINLYIKKIFPPHPLSPNGRPSLSVKPLYREECKCWGVDQGWGHAPNIHGPSEYLDKRGGNAGSAVDSPFVVLSQPWRNAGWPTDRYSSITQRRRAPLAGRKRTEQPDQRGNLLLTNYQLVTFTHRQILPRYLKMGDTYLAQDSCIVLKLNTQITQCSICTVNLYCIADILL